MKEFSLSDIEIERKKDQHFRDIYIAYFKVIIFSSKEDNNYKAYFGIGSNKQEAVIKLVNSIKNDFDKIIKTLTALEQKWCKHNKNIAGVYTECSICTALEQNKSEEGEESTSQ